MTWLRKKSTKIQFFKAYNLSSTLTKRWKTTEIIVDEHFLTLPMPCASVTKPLFWIAKIQLLQVCYLASRVGERDICWKTSYSGWENCVSGRRALKRFRNFAMSFWRAYEGMEKGKRMNGLKIGVLRVLGGREKRKCFF